MVAAGASWGIINLLVIGDIAAVGVELIGPTTAITPNSTCSQTWKIF